MKLFFSKIRLRVRFLPQLLVALICVIVLYNYIGCNKQNDSVDPVQPPQNRMSSCSFTVSISSWENMLHFDNLESFNASLSELEVHDNAPENELYYAIDSIVLRNDFLDCFEGHYNYESLRSNIEDRRMLFLTNNIDTDQDPDNHFIMDKYLRTLLNSATEVRIGDFYYKVLGNDKVIQISISEPDDILKVRNANFAAPCVFPQVLSNLGLRNTKYWDGNVPLSFINSNIELTCKVKLSFERDPNNPGPGINIIFHDSYPNGAFPASSIQSIEIDINNDGFIENTWGSGFPMGNYTFFFPQPTTTQVRIKTTFSNANGQCEAEDIVTLNPGDFACCDKNDREKVKWTYYDNDKRRFKSVVWARNIGIILYHRIGAKTFNEKKKNNGNGWKDEKADNIGARIQSDSDPVPSIYYFKDDEGACGNPTFTHYNGDATSSSNKDKHEYILKIGSTFWVQKNSIHSVHAVDDNGSNKSEEIFLDTDCE